MDLALLIARLQARQDLTPAEVAAAATALASPEVAADAKAAFLTALGDKGETTGEVAAFAQAFRGMAVNPGVEAWATRAIDVVDRKSTRLNSSH